MSSKSFPALTTNAYHTAVLLSCTENKVCTEREEEKEREREREEERGTKKKRMKKIFLK